MKYKAGDKVKIKGIKELIELYCSEKMCDYAGYMMTIDYVGSNLYKMKEDDQRFIWRDYHISKLISKGGV